MKPILRASSLIVLAIAASPSLAQEPPKPVEPENVALGRPVEFERDVRPILEANCTACHSRSSEESDLSVESVDAMVTGGGRGPAIVAGKADESLLLNVAAHRREPVMPPPDNDVKARQLTPRELGILRQWILEGAAKGEAAAAMITWRPLPGGYKAIHSVDLSPTDRFVVAARGNQVEVHDLIMGSSPVRLVDPALAALQHDGKASYPDGAADRDIIQAVAFNPDGTLIATGGYRSIRLWRRSSSEQLPRFDLTGVQTTAVSADGASIVVSVGNELRLLTRDGAVAAKWPATADVTATAISPDGQRIAAISSDNSLRVWSREGQELLARQSVAILSAIAFVGDNVVTAREDGVIDVWSSASEQVERELKGQVGRVVALLAAPGRPNGLVTAGEDGTIRVWDITIESPQRSFSHGSGLGGISLSPDGQRLASCGADGAVRIWNPNDGAKVGEHVGLISLKRDEQQVAEQVEWRKQLAAVEDARVKESEAAVKDREEIHKKAGEAKAATEAALPEADKAAGEKAAAAKAATDALAAAPADENLKKQAEEAKKAADEAQTKATAAKAALESAERARALAEEALKAQQALLAARQQAKSAADEAAKAAEAEWNSKKAVVAQPVAAKAIAYTADGSRIAVAYVGGILQSLSGSGQPLDELTLGDSEAVQIASGAGSTIVARGADGTIRRFDVAEHWDLAATLGPPSDAPLDVARSTIVDRVLALAFSPDGTLLASGGGEPSRLGELFLWNTADRSLIRRIEEPHSDTVQAVEFSRDGRTVATAGADKFVKTFDVSSGELRRSFEGHTDQVLGVSIKADGTLIASASADLGVKIWDRDSGEQRRTITGHGKQVTAVHFVGLTEDVVTSAGDKAVRLERSSNGQQIRSFAGPTDYVYAVAANHDGSIVVGAGEDGFVYIWDGKNGSLKQRIDPPQPPTALSEAK